MINKNFFLYTNTGTVKNRACILPDACYCICIIELKLC